MSCKCPEIKEIHLYKNSYSASLGVYKDKFKLCFHKVNSLRGIEYLGGFSALIVLKGEHTLTTRHQFSFTFECADCENIVSWGKKRFACVEFMNHNIMEIIYEADFEKSFNSGDIIYCCSLGTHKYTSLKEKIYNNEVAVKCFANFKNNYLKQEIGAICDEAGISDLLAEICL